MAEPISGTVAERPLLPMTWGPVWAGFFVVAALQVLLQLFGVAVGITALRPSMHSFESVSIWSAIWVAISTLSAFFFGAWFAVAVGPRGSRAAAMARAVIVWAFATTLGVALVALGLGGAINVARALLMPGNPRAPMVSPYAVWAAWGTFATLALSLGCALLGARVGWGGASPRRRAVVETASPSPPTTVQPTPA